MVNRALYLLYRFEANPTFPPALKLTITRQNRLIMIVPKRKIVLRNAATHQFNYSRFKSTIYITSAAMYSTAVEISFAWVSKNYTLGHRPSVVQKRLHRRPASNEDAIALRVAVCEALLFAGVNETRCLHYKNYDHASMRTQYQQLLIYAASDSTSSTSWNMASITI